MIFRINPLSTVHSLSSMLKYVFLALNLILGSF